MPSHAYCTQMKVADFMTAENVAMQKSSGLFTQTWMFSNKSQNFFFFLFFFFLPSHDLCSDQCRKNIRCPEWKSSFILFNSLIIISFCLFFLWACDSKHSPYWLASFLQCVGFFYLFIYLFIFFPQRESCSNTVCKYLSVWTGLCWS